MIAECCNYIVANGDEKKTKSIIKFSDSASMIIFHKHLKFSRGESFC